MNALTTEQKLVEAFRTQDEELLKCEGHQALWNHVLCAQLPEKAFQADTMDWSALLKSPITKKS